MDPRSQSRTSGPYSTSSLFMKLQASAFFLSLVLVSTEASIANLYTHARGREVLNLAAAAYSTDPLRCLRATYPHSNYRIVELVELPCDKDKNTCAMYIGISSADQQIVVGFRGTTTNEQLILEAKESLEPEVDWYGVGSVNRYFYEGLDPLWAKLHPILKQETTKKYRVLFTGHSLGGALASLAAMKTHLTGMRDNDDISLFTYGEPRVGNRVFAHNLMPSLRETWRIVHRADMVPHLPPCKDLGASCDPQDFRRPFHHGFEVWYPHGMVGSTHFKVCTDNLEDGSCSNSLSPGYEWEDHRWYYGVYVSKHGRDDFCEKPFPDGSENESPSTVLGLTVLGATLLLSAVFGMQCSV